MLRPLGGGGMGAVYLACDTRLAHNVALKPEHAGIIRMQIGERAQLTQGRIVLTGEIQQHG